VLSDVGLRYPETRIANLLQLLGHYLLFRFATPRKPLSEAQRTLRRRARMEVYFSLSKGLAFVDSFRAMTFVMQANRLAHQLDEPGYVARTSCTAVIVSAALRDRAFACHLAEVAGQAAARDGSEEARAYGVGGSFFKSFLVDQDWRATIERGEQALRAWNWAGRGRGLESDVVLQWSCWALELRGELRQLKRRVEELVREARRSGNLFFEVNLRAYHPVIHLMDDEPDKAAADVADAIAQWRPGTHTFDLPNVWALYSQAEILLYQGAVDELNALAPERRRWNRSPFRFIVPVGPPGHFVWGRLALLRAGAARRAGRRREFRRWVRRARIHAFWLRRDPLPVYSLFGVLLAAGAAQVIGHDERAAAALRRAVDGLVATDTGLLVAPARRRLGQTLGGSEGQALIARADADMARQGIRNPARMTGMWLPGWPD
jgi:hypothetical protein